MNNKEQALQLSKEVEKYWVNAPVIALVSEQLASSYMNMIAQKKKANTILLFGEHCDAALLD